MSRRGRKEPDHIKINVEVKPENWILYDDKKLLQSYKGRVKEIQSVRAAQIILLNMFPSGMQFVYLVHDKEEDKDFILYDRTVYSNIDEAAETYYDDEQNPVHDPTAGRQDVDLAEARRAIAAARASGHL